ncbi:MAG: hypothetical protein IIZ92_27080 [Aquincola sp.]|nr:hypothetical protein [Aquincola sp.]
MNGVFIEYREMPSESQAHRRLGVFVSRHSHDGTPERSAIEPNRVPELGERAGRDLAQFGVCRLNHMQRHVCPVRPYRMVALALMVETTQELKVAIG